jgi:hypothetical protein
VGKGVLSGESGWVGLGIAALYLASELHSFWK